MSMDQAFLVCVVVCWSAIIQCVAEIPVVVPIQSMSILDMEIICTGMTEEQIALHHSITTDDLETFRTMSPTQLADAAGDTLQQIMSENVEHVFTKAAYLAQFGLIPGDIQQPNRTWTYNVSLSEIKNSTNKNLSQVCTGSLKQAQELNMDILSKKFHFNISTVAAKMNTTIDMLMTVSEHVWVDVISHVVVESVAWKAEQLGVPPEVLMYVIRLQANETNNPGFTMTLNALEVVLASSFQDINFAKIMEAGKSSLYSSVTIDLKTSVLIDSLTYTLQLAPTQTKLVEDLSSVSESSTDIQVIVTSKQTQGDLLTDGQSPTYVQKPEVNPTSATTYIISTHTEPQPVEKSSDQQLRAVTLPGSATSTILMVVLSSHAPQASPSSSLGVLSSVEDIPGGSKQTCSQGYIRVNDECEVVCKSNEDCSNGGKCTTDRNQVSKCLCSDGYHGERCGNVSGIKSKQTSLSESVRNRIYFIIGGLFGAIIIVTVVLVVWARRRRTVPGEVKASSNVPMTDIEDKLRAREIDSENSQF